MKLNNKFFTLYIKTNWNKTFQDHWCEPWEDTYQEGLLVVNWAQIWKQSLAAISTQAPLTQTSLQGEACTGPAACTMFLPAEPALTKVLLE